MSEELKTLSAVLLAYCQAGGTGSFPQGVDMGVGQSGNLPDLPLEKPRMSSCSLVSRVSFFAWHSPDLHLLSQHNDEKCPLSLSEVSLI